jgi:hypothetical protein
VRIDFAFENGGIGSLICSVATIGYIQTFKIIVNRDGKWATITRVFDLAGDGRLYR